MEEIYYQLGRNKEVPRPDDDFPRATGLHISAIRKRGTLISLLLEKFSAKNVFDKHP